MTADYLMVGGFLGAGKTTALLRAAAHFSAAERRVGLITNDQSQALVDTALLKSRAFAVEEIAGGCFCCRFNSLVEAAARLDTAARPDVFLAEPVGSCTDLTATVALPLRQMYGDRYAIAPLSVLVDPDRALRVLGIEGGGSFTSKVRYIYRKQLEEADVIVVNKIDAVTPARVDILREVLRDQFPSARVVEISARSGRGVAEWVDGLVAAPASGRVLEIDYDTYAEGEARLGWLNATIDLSGAAVEGDALLLSLAGRVHAALSAESSEIAHLKLTLTPARGGGIAVVNAVRTDAPPELAFALDAEIDHGEITLNLRAETDPSRLEQIVRLAVDAEAGDRAAVLRVRHLERFRPSRPVPTHRFAVAT